MSIGETLAQARHQAGLSVAQVSEQTRIRPLIIRGMEADDYSMCGGDFYARGNIRDIAEVVGTDPGPLIDEYDQVHRATGPAAATSLDELLDRSGPGRPHWHRTPAFMLVFGVAAVLIVLAFVGYQMMGAPQPGPAGLSAADSNAHPTQAADGSGGSPDAARSARATAGSGAPSSAPAATPAPSQTAPPAGQAAPHTLTPLSAAAFGAHGGLGRGDDPQDAHLAIDGRRGTAWHTDWYTTPRFGNLYGGTGLIVDMGRPVTVTAVRVTLGAAVGARFAVRVGNQPILADMPRAALSAGPGGVVRLTLAHPATGRYVLVWFTMLPPNVSGNYQAAIYGIGVKGRP